MQHAASRPRAYAHAIDRMYHPIGGSEQAATGSANNAKGILARGNEPVSLPIDKQHQVKTTFARQTSDKDQATAPRVYGRDFSLAHSARSGDYGIKPTGRPSLCRWPRSSLEFRHIGSSPIGPRTIANSRQMAWRRSHDRPISVSHSGRSGSSPMRGMRPRAVPNVNSVEIGLDHGRPHQRAAKSVRGG